VIARTVFPFRFLAFALLALALTGCVGGPRVATLAVQPSVEQLQAGRGVWPEFVYYPDYEVYYSQNYQLYVFRYNYAWVTQTEPPDLPPGALEHARAVPMAYHFYDPIAHHREISGLFPRRATSAD
jgi:hypothetical protein